MGAFASDLTRPTVRLGVTGLSRAGKTVFVTALVHNLVASGKLPFFRAVAEGRVRRAWLEPQPDDTVPRFEIEQHLKALMSDPPTWPESTRRISQLRVTLDYEPDSAWRYVVGSRHLNIDIVDYPGEWLLDLSLLGKSYEDWSREALALAGRPERTAFARDLLAYAGGLDPAAAEDEQVALTGSRLFKAYLQATRKSGVITGLTPGRFLMPGDLEGTPALTFLPLDSTPQAVARKGSLAAMMARRFEAYKARVVLPFFRDYFSRLDRQIVLVDALGALDAGPAAIADLGTSLEAVLACFRAGANTLWSSLFARRIDRILFAATKADHLHHSSHDRLEAILGRLVNSAVSRAQFAGAKVRVMGLAAVRATREAEMGEGAGRLPCIVGTPLAGEQVGGQLLDGRREVAVFPGDLPQSLEEAVADAPGARLIRLPRFRPPLTVPTATDPSPPFPHIRLDRALDFLIGDRLT